MTGRCVRSRTSATPLRSSVCRVARSNVRIPRSHRMTSAFPSARMYSAAESHSSIVAPPPRLRRTGRPRAARRAQQREVLHVARADLQDVGVAGDDRHFFPGEDLRHHRQARLLACFRQELQAAHAQALELVGRGAGLVSAAAEHVRARSRHGLRDLEQHLLALDRARPGDQDRPLPSDLDAPHRDARALGLLASIVERDVGLGPMVGRRRRRRRATGRCRRSTRGSCRARRPSSPEPRSTRSPLRAAAPRERPRRRCRSGTSTAPCAPAGTAATSG